MCAIDGCDGSPEQERLLSPIARLPSWLSFSSKTPAAFGPLSPRQPWLSCWFQALQGRCKLMSAGFEAFNWTLRLQTQKVRDVDADVITLD